MATFSTKYFNKGTADGVQFRSGKISGGGKQPPYDRKCHKFACHCEEHSEAIVNHYDCQWQSFIRLRDAAISCGVLPICDIVPGDRHAALAMTQKFDGL